MKKFYLLTLLCILIASESKSLDYYWDIKVSNQEHDRYYSIAGISEGHIYLMKLRNQLLNHVDIVITDTAFQNWESRNIILENPTNLRFFDACITSANKMYIVADSGYIFESNDMGVEWETRKVIQNSKYITEIEFRDANYGILVNNANELYYTNDAGESWNKSLNQIDDFYIHNVNFIGDTLFLSMYNSPEGKSYTKMSFDAGNSWEPTYVADTANANIQRIYYKNGLLWSVNYKNTIFGDREYDIIRHSNDNGKTWQNQLFEEKGAWSGLYSIKFYDNLQEGLAVGTYDVYYTSDAGENWVLLIDTLSNPHVETAKHNLLKINNEIVIIGNSRIFRFIRGINSVHDIEDSKQQLLAYSTAENNIEIQLLNHEKIDRLYLYDLKGSVIYNDSNILSNQITIDKDKLKVSGTILCTVHTGNDIYFTKIILQK